MDPWTGFAIALPSFAGGVGITAWFARAVIRHKRRSAYLGFVASLNTLADSIGEDTDPRRIAADLHLKAEQWRRSADALRSKGSTR